MKRSLIARFTLLLIFCGSPLASSVAAQAPSFFSSKSISIGNDLVQAVSADFNHDGYPDFAIADSPGVTVVLSNGKGGYQAPVTYQVTGTDLTSAIAVADMNNDGYPDIIVGTYRRFFGIQIFLNNGSGIFPNSPIRTQTGNPGTIAVADLNGDGRQDVVLLQSDGPMGVCLGNGDGTLQAEVTYSPLAGTFSPREVRIGDINHDGIPDIVTDNGVLSLFLGNGNGTFKPATKIDAVPNFHFDLQDVNGDGLLDLVILEAKGIGVYLNQGQGTFGSIISSSSGGVGGLEGTLVMGDFNGDGKIDVAVSSNNPSFTGGVIMLGLGNGQFRPPVTRYASFGQGASLVAVDANKDGKLDIVGTSYSNLLLTFGMGNGAVQASRDYPAPAPTFDITQMATGDFNNDGNVDVATLQPPLHTGPAYVGIMLGTGKGALQPSLPTFTLFDSGRTGMATGDFNHDGKLDLAVWVLSDSQTTSQVGVYLGNGDGTFQPPILFSAGISPVGIALGDFNGDGNLDIAVLDQCGNPSNCFNSNGAVNILLGNGDGTMRQGGVFRVPPNPESIAAGDLYNNGKVDVAVDFFGSYGTSAPGILVLNGAGDGTFQNGFSTNFGSELYDLQIADMNNDGNLDLVTGDYGGSVDVLLGNGQGGFGLPIATSAPFAGSYVIADFNGDGNLDLAVNDGFTNVVPVYVGSGTGSFAAGPQLFPGGGSTATALLGNDSLPDILIGGPGVFVMTNLTQ